MTQRAGYLNPAPNAYAMIRPQSLFETSDHPCEDIILKSSGACFNTSRTCRYMLWRIWDQALPIVTFAMLNPSRADESTLDNTLRRTHTFARVNGYGGMIIVNLIPFVSPSPKDAVDAEDRAFGENSGGRNVQHIQNALRRSKTIVVGFGTWVSESPFREAYQQLKEILNERSPVCLGHNADGSPKHPLYVAANTPLEVFRNATPWSTTPS